MDEFWTTLQHLVDAEALLKSGGFYLLLFIVFAETGLFFGFFLPGDYLLFLAGLFVASGILDTNIYTLCVGLILAAVIGNFVGYVFGRRAGPMLFKREDSLLFKKKYVVVAEEFYHKYGAAALILGRFLPIIRTFAPIFAGIVRVDFKKFALYNVVGALLWVLTLTLAGYFLGKEFPQIINYIEYIVVGFIVFATGPILYAFLKRQFKHRKAKDI
ncbi:MAG TPA: VTT domain-containing protein [Sphingobacteriaceae bacterium]|nr:VTT domain-containing protein [Sphingobacteriaceae bacterium]